jgi:hypothetical protein
METEQRSALWKSKMKETHKLVRAGDMKSAWEALEDAHILSQPAAWPHFRTHLEMFKLGLATRNWNEIVGQIPRMLVAVPASWAGTYPLGNSGRANISMFQPMPLPERLKLFEQPTAEVESHGKRTRVVLVASVFDAPTSWVWEAVQRYSTLRFIMRGLIHFSGTMPERIEEGNSLLLRLWFFGLVPGWRHRLSISKVDQDSRTIQSRESGGIVRRWDHQIRVGPTPDGKTEYVDEIVIDAGFLTPVVCLWADFQYRYRHRRWKRLVK